MSKHNKQGPSQKGQPNAESAKQVVSAEEVERATHPTKRQNSEQ
ncbi:hypothetical protein ACQCT5_04045 [Sutcliffiella halmapala]|jgi:hypothetical protein|uniref:Uncharacterized protein n=1 Tax=Sutcliffiella tianshenii TaxID=1463404 RepID=A0ABS2P2J1_9BACI|nr:hypothetical protein [Bacillus tianshenii]MBM7621166.1 hypothetical protein [Bacillus tianshenii]